MRFLLLILLLAAAGCATQGPPRAPVAAPVAPLFRDAQGLAQGHAGLQGRARRDNAEAIERLLGQVDDATLARETARLASGDPLYNFAGRVLLRRGLPLPRPFDREGAGFGAPTRPPADRDGYRPPLNVALLLPLAGSQAAAAEAVRDGYLAGYYGERRRRPLLRFYDTGAGARAAYARAVADGNDLVVGPLGRDDVDALMAADGSLEVPLLALNRGDRAVAPGSAAFSLSPEDEGVSLAEALVERRSRRVLLVAGTEDAQRRTAEAASRHLQRRGVQVLARDLVALDAAVPQLAQDGQRPDAVLLVLRAPQARQAVAALRGLGFAEVPWLASSQITSGLGKAGEDAALDGILFPTEPWLTGRVEGLPPLASVAARVDSGRGAAARLFAFGYDAWLLTAYLDHLAADPNAAAPGATGRLGLDGFGTVLRRPAWSRFVGGVPVAAGDAGR